MHSVRQLEDPPVKSAHGPLFFAVFALLFLGGSYAMWPPDFFDSPMTFAAVLRALASPVLAILGLEFLFAFAIVSWSDG